MNKLTAVLRDGREVTPDPARHGSTIESLIASLTADSLTGSAVPLAEARVTLVGGGEIAYSDINVFAEESDFER